MNTLAIEGIDGAGKTSVVEHLTHQLEDEGLIVATCALYRHTQEQSGVSLYELWQHPEGAAQAVDLLTTACHETEAAAEDQGANILIYDRHWMTAYTELGDNTPLTKKWGHRPPTAYLRVAPEVALARSTNDHDEPWSTLEMQKQYADRYEKIAKQYMRSILGIYRSDVDVSPQAIARNIIWDWHIQR